MTGFPLSNRADKYVQYRIPGISLGGQSGNAGRTALVYRHLAVTLQTIGIGVLIPAGLKFYGYGSAIPPGIVVIRALIAIWLEVLAVRILGNIQDETEEEYMIEATVILVVIAIIATIVVFIKT